MQWRSSLKSIGASISALMLAGSLLALPAGSGYAQAANKEVKIAVGSRVINIIYPYLNMPLALGYWEKDGYDVELIPMGGSLEAVQQMAAGRVDFAMMNSNTLIQANVDTGLDLRAVMLVGAHDWSVAVLKDGGINDVKDFKGKSIGVPTLSTGGILLLRTFLEANGLTPDVDVSILPVGFGGPALEALRSGQVQALMFFQTGITGFQNMGADLRLLHSPEWRDLPDFTLVTTQKLIDSDPGLVEAVVRNALKGQHFSMTNPDCTRRIQWKTWPESAPTGADAETLAKWDQNLLLAQQNTMKLGYALGGSKLWGYYSPEMAGKLQSFLSDAGVLKSTLPVEQFVITVPDFFEAVNEFDRKAVEAQAQECAGF